MSAHQFTHTHTRRTSLERLSPPWDLAMAFMSSIVSFGLPAQVGHQRPLLIVPGIVSQTWSLKRCHWSLVRLLEYSFETDLPPRLAANCCIGSIVNYCVIINTRKTGAFLKIFTFHFELFLIDYVGKCDECRSSVAKEYRV